jgi:F-type H+-transporting ATPase subunit delta
MSGEAITVARPYAEAIFARAEETGQLQAWADMLAFLEMLVQDGTMSRIIADPQFDRHQMADLIISIAEQRLTEEGGNLVRLLAENGRVTVLPEMRALYQELMEESLRTITVEVHSAYQLEAEQEQEIAAALKEKLGREVTIVSKQQPDLIGGVHIRAGDMVIDGSIKGRLEQLANELGI